MPGKVTLGESYQSQLSNRDDIKVQKGLNINTYIRRIIKDSQVGNRTLTRKGIVYGKCRAGRFNIGFYCIAHKHNELRKTGNGYTNVNQIIITNQITSRITMIVSMTPLDASN